jgi:hypothetical protein
MRGLLLTAFAAAICTLSGSAGHESARSDLQAWREIGWPFARDGWPAGRAFRCADQSCGDGIELYVRPKIGFCNCDSGVADDDEVDRVADLDLLSESFVPLEPGKPIRIGDMSGRSRPYHLRMSDSSRHIAIGFAISRRCDLLVAAAQGKGTANTVQSAAMEFLVSNKMTEWMRVAMDQP